MIGLLRPIRRVILHFHCDFIFTIPNMSCKPFSSQSSLSIPLVPQLEDLQMCTAVPAMTAIRKAVLAYGVTKVQSPQTLFVNIGEILWLLPCHWSGTHWLFSRFSCSLHSPSISVGTDDVVSISDSAGVQLPFSYGKTSEDYTYKLVALSWKSRSPSFVKSRINNVRTWKLKASCS